MIIIIVMLMMQISAQGSGHWPAMNKTDYPCDYTIAILASASLLS